MNIEVGYNQGDLNKMMAFTEKLVGDNLLEACVLSLVASESYVLLLKENWAYNEDYARTVEHMRSMARLNASAMVDAFFTSLKSWQSPSVQGKRDGDTVTGSG
jgi:hypothetical protein